jgi:CheY-like chemotaxis protein
VILIVDDDPRILAMTRGALVDQGYTVIACDGGAAALAALAKHPAITLLLSDVLMPEMNGTELARHAKQVRPGLRVLFMSGDTGDTDPASFGDAALLTKPFTRAALIQAVEMRLATA